MKLGPSRADVRRLGLRVGPIVHCCSDDASDIPPRCAVVTGAGSGIGRAVAQALLGRGERVVVAGRRLEALCETVDGWPRESALVVPTDVTSETSVRALFDQVREEWVRIDLLFNNAGIFGPAVPVQDVDLTQWHAVVDTNLTGAFLCAREAFRVMRAAGTAGWQDHQ